MTKEICSKYRSLYISTFIEHKANSSRSLYLGCPKSVKKETICHAHTNSFIVKTLGYRLQKDGKTGISSCGKIVQLKRLPPPPCPPKNETSIIQSRDMEEVCNPETCERYFVSNEWQLEGCECRKLKNKMPVGKCCRF